MIYGKDLRLRAPERSDLPRFVAWMNDPEVNAGLLAVLPMSQAEEEAWFENMLKSVPAQHPLVIEALHADVWTPIGNCGFHDIDWRCRSAEIGIWIGEKSFWNHGYGTQVMRMLLRHGFETLNLNRIMLCVFENNPRAIRCYEKVGFVHEGRLRQGMYKNGTYLDVLFMSILREEYEQGKSSDQPA
ncbi:MAG TPA: GNAT family protein [Anaerolineaceae bacterium]|nr:GNAT family protein [Anaerolineaceae bacterium]